MRIQLDYEECRAALAEAIQQKTKLIYGEISPDDCCFKVEDADGKIVYVAELSFGCDV